MRVVSSSLSALVIARSDGGLGFTRPLSVTNITTVPSTLLSKWDLAISANVNEGNGKKGENDREGLRRVFCLALSKVLNILPNTCVKDLHDLTHHPTSLRTHMIIHQ